MEPAPGSKESQSSHAEPNLGANDQPNSNNSKGPLKVDLGFGASMQPGFKEHKGSASKLPKPHELEEEVQQQSIQLQVTSPMHASDSLYDFGPPPYIEGAITPKGSTQDFSQTANQESSASAECDDSEPIAFTPKPSEPDNQ